MAREPRTLEHRRLEAEHALVAGVQRILFDPNRVHSVVLDDLRQTPDTPEALDDWARRHGLEAPCLICAAKELWRDGWEGESRGMPESATWHQRMQELSSRPPAWRSTVPRKSIASVEEAALMKQRAFQALEEELETVRAGGRKTGEARRVIEAEMTRLSRFYHQELPAARASEAERARDWLLRPQIFDPTADSFRECEQRWHDHCRTMTEETQRHGAAPITRRAPDLELAVNRAIAFQFDGRSHDEIGALEQPPVSADVVRKSIRSLARLVDWNLRSVGRGRRPHSADRRAVRKRAG